MTNFKELLIWKKAFDIGLSVLKLTKEFPKTEQYGLVSQLNRSAVSVASNIAERAGRESRKEFEHFLNIATGSSYEMETQLLFAVELDYITKSNYLDIHSDIDQLQRMLRSFKSKLREALSNSSYNSFRES